MHPASRNKVSRVTFHVQDMMLSRWIKSVTLSAYIFDDVSVVSSVVSISGPPEARGQCNAINNWVEVKSEE